MSTPSTTPLKLDPVDEELIRRLGIAQLGRTATQNQLLKECATRIRDHAVRVALTPESRLDTNLLHRLDTHAMDTLGVLGPVTPGVRDLLKESVAVIRVLDRRVRAAEALLNDGLREGLVALHTLRNLVIRKLPAFSDNDRAFDVVRDFIERTP